MLIVFLIIIGIGVFAIACRVGGSDLLEPDASDEVSLTFVARYVRTDGVSMEDDVDSVIRMKAREDLIAYIQSAPNDFDCSAFDGLNVYNEEYFEGGVLYVIRLQEHSGSVRHEVTDVQVRGEVVIVDIDRIVPEIGTADMAQWHIFIEIPKEQDPGGTMEVQLNRIWPERIDK